PRSTFEFVRELADVGRICELIDSFAADEAVGPATLVLNFSYFFASESLDVSQLIAVVRSLLSKYRRSTIWIVYQNPQGPHFAEKWKDFEASFGVPSGVTCLDGGETTLRYLNTTNLPGKILEIDLSYALLRRDPVPDPPSGPR